MPSIGDVFMRMMFEDQQLTAEAKRAGTKVGDAAGKSMAGRLKANMGPAIATGIGTVLGVGFAIAGKGAAELDEATTNLIRDTGLVGGAADEAKDQLASMYRDNLQGFDQISAALSKVHTDLGLTGDAAGVATEKFLKYQQATGQTSDAVAVYDDILDAWNLTADQAPAIMDKLIAGHHKFGGVIGESESALAAMAPAMTAANMTVDDGIALINLFNDAGIDASKAPAALAKALKQLKPGQDLNDLIAQIGAIEDPTLRAQRAMTIFGGKGGTQFAQAFKPGIASLREYNTTAEETVGITDEMAEASLSWGDKWKIALKNVGGLLAQFGQNFGPLLMVAGQFGPKAIGLISGGLGALLGKSFPGLVAKLGLSRGQTPATPMYVADVTPGGAAGAAGAGAGKAGLLKFIGALGLAAVAVELWQNSLVPLNEDIAKQTTGISEGVEEGLKTVSADQLQVQRDALVTGLNKILATTQGLGPLQGVLYGSQIDSLKADIAKITGELERRGPSGAPDRLPQFGGKSPDERDEEVTKGLDVLHADLETAIATIKTTGDPAALGAAVASAVQTMLGGAGSAETTQSLIGNLQTQLVAAEAANNAPLAAQIKAAIAQLEPFARGRQWQAEQIAEARKVVASNATTAEKVASLKGIQADLLSHQRTMAAGIVGGLLKVETGVNKLPSALKNALGGTLFGGSAPGKEEDDTNTGLPKSPPRPRGVSLQDIQDVRERATGGPVTARTPYWVGEKGPELYVPGMNGRILPNHDIPGVARAAGDGGVPQINVTLNGLPRSMDPFEVVTQLKRVRDFVTLTPGRRIESW